MVGQGQYESHIQAVGDLFSSILHNIKKVTSGQHKTCTTVKMVVKYQANLMWWDAKETCQGWTDQMLIGITKAQPRKSKHGI